MRRINPEPKMLISLINAGVFRDNKFSIVDVGTRGGVQPRWRLFRDQIQIIGFEPDTGECKRLNRDPRNRTLKCFPVALYKNKSRKKLFIPRFSYACSLYDNTELFRGVDAVDYVIPRNSIYVDTIDFDTFAREHNISGVDFMKIHAEGAELDILQGCRGLLEKKELFGIEVETRFPKITNNASCFADLDNFLRSRGFHLFQLDTNRFARSALPKPMLHDFRDSDGSTVAASTTTGQVLNANALYLRDFVLDNYSPESGNQRAMTRILKLACLYELYELSDCAAEIILRYKDIISDKFDVDSLLDLLTPSLYGKTWKYREYINEAKKAFYAKEGRVTMEDDSFLLRTPEHNLGHMARHLYRDLHRNLFRGRPSVVTYMRIFLKLTLGRYP